MRSKNVISKIRIGTRFIKPYNYMINLTHVKYYHLSNRTFNNLLQLIKLYNFDWCNIISYSVSQYRYSPIMIAKARNCSFTTDMYTGHGYFIYGSVDNIPCTYARKETCHKSAGQTIVYIGNAIRLQIGWLLPELNKTKIKLHLEEKLNQKRNRLIKEQIPNFLKQYANV